MGVIIMTSWDTLLSLAKAVGTAKKEGDTKKIKKAEKELEAYKRTCLKSNGMLLNTKIGEL